jgi:dienelactone hydrolase
MQEFRDRTGRSGPATWEVGSYAQGKDDHPVSGVSWYEAAAYAEFAGKSLPTVYHWAAAATIGAAAYITPTSNVNNKEPAPVGTFEAVTGRGAFDMAGNVREWCSNAVANGSARYHLGGSWADPPYMFTYGDARDPFDRSEGNGFRLVKYLTGEIPSAVSDPIRPPLRTATRTRPSGEVLDAYSALYRYDPLPLEPRVESRDDSAEHWIREVVTFTSTDGTERWPAHVFLPKNARPPYQALVFAPGAGVISPTPVATALGNPAALGNFTYLMMSGRAVIYPVYSGTHERNTWQTSPWPDPERTGAFQHWMVQVSLDARRAADYLLSRDDIDAAKLGYVGQSWGSLLAPRVLAFDQRFKVGVLIDGGAGSGTATPAFAAVDSFNFAPRVTQPVLMVNGSEDFIFPVDSAQKPLFDLLGTAPAHKRHFILPGGHGILNQQRSQVMREALDWLDKYLGPAAR